MQGRATPLIANPSGVPVRAAYRLGSVVLLAAAASVASEPTSFLDTVRSLLNDGRAGITSERWATHSSLPRLCIPVHESLHSPEAGAMDGNLMTLHVDLQRQAVWVGIRRGLDGTYSYKGPATLDSSGNLRPVSHDSLPACHASSGPHAS